MRVCYVGNFEPEYSTENDVRKAFEHLGHEVVRCQEDRTNYPTIQRLALECDLLLMTSSWDTAIPLEIWITIVKQCADKGIPTATLHLDTFWGKGRNGRKWWLNPMFHTAYIFTADGDYEQEWKAFGRNHIWLPPAVRHDAAHIGKFSEGYACDVAFVGSNGQGYHEDVWPYRKELVDQLRNMCRRNGWSFKNPGGDHPKISRGEDMNDFYASAKVTVGDSLCLKKEGSHYWSDRVPEATGRGGVLIMPKVDAIEATWLGWIGSYAWGNYADLEAKVKDLLADGERRQAMRNMGHAITSTDHTYINRVGTILEMVGS